jgi:Tfp pilus assembly protein PilW
MKNGHNKGFTVAEVLVATSLGALILAGVMSALLMFCRSGLRIADYESMESEATKALELIARDIRMAQSIQTDAPSVVNAANRATISSIKLTVPNSANTSTSVVEYKFTTANTLVRIAGGNTTVLVKDLQAGSAQFAASNLNSEAAANDYETNQIKMVMTVKPSTKGNYVETTKRVLSARFVLRNR